MQLTTTDADRVLRKLQFELVACKHHVRGFFVLDGKRLFPVHFSFGKKELPGRIPDRFRSSLRLSRPEFERLLACSMNREEYVRILKERGIASA